MSKIISVELDDKTVSWGVKPVGMIFATPRGFFVKLVGNQTSEEIERLLESFDLVNWRHLLRPRWTN